jgi:hypothetical protein
MHCTTDKGVSTRALERLNIPACHPVLAPFAHSRINPIEDLMRKFTTTLAAAAAVLLTISMSANAQASAGAGIHALVQNATPIVKQVACQGWGPYCPPGFVRACGPYRCWCRPCS